MDKLKVGLIGIGRIAQDHLAALAKVEAAEVFALSSRNREALTKAAERFGAKALYQDYHELLANKDVQAVMICTPNRLHYSMALEALEAGKHVFLEKPMAETLREGCNIAITAAAEGLTVSVCYLSRYMPVFAEAARLIKSGAVGKPLMFTGRRFWHRDKFPEWWAAEKHLAIPHFGSHSLDLGVWYLGGTGTRVFAEGLSTKSAFSGESEYSLVARMTTGAILSLDFSMTCRRAQFDHVIICENATISIPGVTKILLDEKTHFEIDEDDCYKKGFYEEAKEFVAAVLEDRESLTSAGESLKSMELVEAAVRSAETGQSVTIAGEPCPKKP